MNMLTTRLAEQVSGPSSSACSPMLRGGEQYLDSCGIFRDAVLSILTTIAKQERLRRSERASAAIAKLRRKGKTDHLGRRRLVVDREKIQQMAAEGKSVRAIAAELGMASASVHRIVRSAA